MTGIWLLIPEHLRLGTWDILETWATPANGDLDRRLALQLINESSLCVRGIRGRQTLSQKGFEVANGLPFVATDEAIHKLLNKHTVKDAQNLQVFLGKIRQTFGHFSGELLAIDPHRIKSHSKRQMNRKLKDSGSKPTKVAQTFFCLDADTKQPICFTTGTSARTVTQATPELLELTKEILSPIKEKVLVMADNEHYSIDLLDWVALKSPFDILVPMKTDQTRIHEIQKIPKESFKRHWAGYATTKRLFLFKNSSNEHFHQFIQRTGEKETEYEYSTFLCTSDRNEMKDLAIHYPQRWHIEEFFNKEQDLGWKKAGSMNLNVQYSKMSMSLFSQAAIHMLRERLGEPIESWNAESLSKNLFRGLEGDIRVKNNTIFVTYYNAKNVDLLKNHYENLSEKLLKEGVSPSIPWLYNYKLCFEFK